MKKRVVDLAAACVCMTVIGIVWIYPDQIRWGEPMLWAAGILLVCFLILAVRDKKTGYGTTDRPKMAPPSESELITEIVLLNEEDGELAVWDIYGKTALVIGRDVALHRADVRGSFPDGNQIDIDLSQGPYAGMVDLEHAVLNFSSGNWYVEDLGSANGISVKKAGDGKVYKLSADNPCRLERGDCLYVGLNRLLLR